MVKKLIFKNIFSIIIILLLTSLIPLSLTQPSLDDDKKEDEPEMVVGYISLNFKVSQGMLIAPVKVGTPEQEMNLVLDIGSSRTWISDQSFKKSDSSSYSDTGEDEEKSQYDFTYSGDASTETFNLAEKKLTGFKFLLFNNLVNNKIQGALYFGNEQK